MIVVFNVGATCQFSFANIGTRWIVDVRDFFCLYSNVGVYAAEYETFGPGGIQTLRSINRMISPTVQESRCFKVMERPRNNHNVLMSLPTSLIHCIVADWVDAFSVIRLDIALSSDDILHVNIVEMLRSDHFYLKKVDRIKNFLGWQRPPPTKNAHSKVLNWLLLRQVKVIELELHEHCCDTVIENYLMKFGEHVRHICPSEDSERSDKNNRTQNNLIAQHCHNLISYSVRNLVYHDYSILRVLCNNFHLENLYFYGGQHNKFDPVGVRELALPNLKQLKWVEHHALDVDLLAVIKAAPNLRKLAMFCVNYSVLDGYFAANVGRACSQLRTFSCKELHIGRNDSFLKPFLAACNHIVNLDLNGHYELTDNVLIAALSELHSLHSLDLRGCCRLTDKTLQFLAQRFASILRVLYLDRSVHPYLCDGEGNPVVREEVQGGYTSAGIASLRTQCTHLHTFHYFLKAGSVQSTPTKAYQLATTVEILNAGAIPLVLEHCTQIEIVAFSFRQYEATTVWLSVEQLMLLAARCPRLRTVVIMRDKYALMVDYSAVKKAFPKLMFNEDRTVLDFDVLKMPV